MERLAKGAYRFGLFEATLRSEELRLAIGGRLPPAPRILDIGSADAAVASALLGADGCLLAVDIDRERLVVGARAAREKALRACFVEADAAALPVCAASCDVALLYEILELVPDPEAVIREATRVLRPNGIVYIVTPNPFSPSTILSDPHAHLPFTHFLPRRLAHAYAFTIMRRSVLELGEHFSMPSWSRIERGFRAVGMRLELQSNLLKLDRPDLVLSRGRRRLAWILRALGASRFARTALGHRIVHFYDRHVARSWAIVAKRA